jgi:dTDP-3-amino-3,4,6-trideoxy-alpha-D-glucose transaminase
MGVACEKLEREFAAWLGVRGAVTTGFGRGALWLALEAADVSAGEVAVPELTCAQVTEAVRHAGARPVFYPVQCNLTFDAQGFETALTPRTRAAILVHYWGRVLPGIEGLAEICRRRGVFCLEDCALALGAAAIGQRAGRFGSAAVFSFTKSDWCYGGGMVASDSEAYLSRLRTLREQQQRTSARLAFGYGLLRRVDYAANRPRWCAVASLAGPTLQDLLFATSHDFYSQGRMDVTMPEIAARRALQILHSLQPAARRRREIVLRLREILGDHTGILFWPQLDPQETFAFLLLLVRPGGVETKSALDLVKAAGRHAVTLRLAWPAYQPAEPGQSREALAWWAEHLAILEVNPNLSGREVERIGKTLSRLVEKL